MELETCLRFSLFGFLISSFFLQGLEAAPCPEDWLVEGRGCFGILPEKQTWVEAELKCQEYGKGGHLASFRTKAQWDIVAKFIIANFKDVEDVWVGLHDPRKTNKWSWVDRTILAFFPWNVGEPKNKGGYERCAHTTVKEGFKKLNEANCKEEKSAICKSRKM